MRDTPPEIRKGMDPINSGWLSHRLPQSRHIKNVQSCEVQDAHQQYPIADKTKILQF